MARRRTGILKRDAVDGDKLPLIPLIVQSEFDDAPDRRANLAIRPDRLELVKGCAARTDNELPDAASRVGAAVRILRREPFIRKIGRASCRERVQVEVGGV